jgi:hypothetical protein
MIIFRGGNMKIKNLTVSALSLMLLLGLALLPRLAAQEKTQEKQEKATRVIIPETIKAAIQEGIQTRQPRLDLPFTIIKCYYFPAQRNIHVIVLFNVKNSDLDFASVTSGIEGQKEKKKKEKEVQSIFEATPNKLNTKAHFSLQFNKLENNIPGELVREIHIPFDLEVDGVSYEPDKKESYSIGTIIPPGSYLLSTAITSQKLEKIGTQYRELSLPDPLSFSGELVTTPIFFAKNIEQMSAPEMQAVIHKGFFTYSILQIEPNLENLFSPWDKLELFFVVFGAKPNEKGKFDIEINYEVYKGEEIHIRFQSQTYDSPLVSQPLPLKRTALIKSEQGEKTETRDLEAGSYTLSLVITDKISGMSITRTIDFEVKT